MMTLKDEINAEKGSFLLELRTDKNWNHDKFLNLIERLNEECQAKSNDTELSREISSGVWYISTFVKDWTTHENFPKEFTNEYYTIGYSLIEDLTYYYFMGESMYQSEGEIEGKIEKLKTRANTRANNSVDE